MRVLIDTNCLLMCAPQRSVHHWLFRAVREGQLQVVMTTEILAEYEEQLGQFYSPDYARLILFVLTELPDTILLNPISYTWGLITVDPDDNKFVDAAIAANADWIITNDRHFDVLDNIPFPKVNHIRLDAFRVHLLGELPG